MTAPRDSFGALKTLETSGGSVLYYNLHRLTELGAGEMGRLPFSIRILLENLLRRHDGTVVTDDRPRRHSEPEDLGEHVFEQD